MDLGQINLGVLDGWVMDVPNLSGSPAGREIHPKGDAGADK